MVATQQKPKTTANFKFGTGFFSVFPFWPILTGLMGSGLVVLVDYNSFYEAFVGLYRHKVCH